MWKPHVVLATLVITTLITQSEAFRKCKKPNEVYDLCPNPCPPRECGVNIALILCAPAPKPGSKDCKPGCRCKDGFLKNKAGVCIPENECKYDCAKNEILDRCYSDCPPRFCGVNIAAVSCLAIEESDCERGCRCRDGYLRNAEGKCILEKQCPKCPKQNEVYDVCPAPCPPRRCDVDDRLIDCQAPPRPGDPECEPGCRCADGHARNDSGICIPRDQCPEEQCGGPNEAYDKCPNPCPPQRCNIDPRVIRCKAPPKPGDPECKPGCQCFEGHARDDYGLCIPREQCPEEKCRKINEVYKQCLNPCPLHRCDVDPRVIKCAAPPMPGDPECQPGCECYDGYARNDDGICVPRDQCPQERCRGPNEMYNKCPNPCPPKRCDVDPRVIRCAAPPEPGDPECQPGCECFDGYARNESGICIPRDQCPEEQCRGPNEMYNECLDPCPLKQCDVDPSVILCAAPPEPGDPECQSGCECFDGYARDADGICIPRDQCPQNCKGQHEIYSECPALVCRPLNCTQVGFPQPCPHPGPDPLTCPGKPGCICDSGYARKSCGKCIPIKKCSACGGDPNAVLGCGNRGRHCSDRNNEKPAVSTKKCKEKTCACRKGYWYDDNTGKCVLPGDCTQTCGKDEVYSACTNSECGPKNCSQLGFPIPCPRIDPKNCIKGCLCKEGYVRAANGTCIPRNKCPSCGGDPKAVSGCGNCRKTCSNYNSSEPMFCTKICYINGCVCKEGLVVDDSTGKCINPKKCVSCGGDFNAKPGCDENCTKRCPGPKPAECKCYKDGCRCKDGFVYDPKSKKCVRPEECTPPCGNNEVLSNCSNGGCGPWRCTDVGIPTGCVKMDQKYCTVGCVCQEGYVRDENEVCIPVTDCPECGGDPNAIAGCGKNCGRLCSNYKNAENIFCTADCDVNGCDCRKGFVKDENTNRCVKPKDCTPICKKNEVFSECINGGCEAKNCSQLGKPVPCVRPAKCKQGCLCAEGYLRDANGNCIPKDQCPPKCTRANEIYDSCPPSCPPQTCESIGQKYFCPLMPANKTSKNCHGACRCKPNFFRNKNGECISAKNCLKCTGPHEFYSCGGACDNVCETLNKQNQTNCPIINIKCNEMCYCEEGYARDKNKICIPIEECPAPICKEHEEYSECTNGGCQARNCSQLGQPVPCIKLDPKSCIKGCVCEEGYLRARNGTCVPEDKCDNCNKPHEHYDSCAPSCPPQTCESIGRMYKCPATAAVCRGACRCDLGYYRNKKGECIRKRDCLKCKGPHEYFSCGSACDNVCSTLDKQNQTNCPIINIKCVEQCYCEEGYARDSSNVCIPIDTCLPPTCGKDEVFSECINGGCGPKNCSQFGKPVPCVKMDPKYCIKGCLCKEGYLRDSDGTCVPQEKCRENCMGQNEEYDACPPTCPPQTCESVNKTYHCPLIKTDKNSCKPACRCKEGFFRNKRGQCITRKNCLKCTGPNEYFTCGGACDNVCKTLSQQNQTSCPIINIQCNSMCYCNEGYARNDENICVPFHQCPPQKCGENERLEDCPDWLCSPQSCSQLGYPIACPAFQGESTVNQTCPGSPGCVCNNNYVRNDDGVCIPVDQCPSCGGDPNAASGCGNCGRQCSDYKRKNAICPLICQLNGCRCKDGYVHDANLNKCVLPKDCTPTCGLNEVYDTCANGGCQKRNCSQVGQPTLCIDPIKCNGGCVCQEGYLRNETGYCVPENECTGTLKCTKRHEVYDPCPRTCPPQTCNAIGVAYPCPNPPEGEEFCSPACRCEDGYYRNSVEECISEANCLKCPKPNEHFSCGPECDNVCATLSTQNRTNCPIVNKRCVEKCYCDNNYARDENDICIPIDQCNVSCKGDPNATPGCGGNCVRCSNYGRVVACPLICMLGGCDCKPGYIYDDNLNKCVLPENCTPVCKKNEAYNTCINGGCQKKKCSDLGRPDICIHPKECVEGCLCKKGFLRADNGTCVPINKCPEPVCPKYEVFSTCANGGCDRRKCSELTGPVVCRHTKECIGDCVCVKGYLRNDDGVCVPESQCNPTCLRPHEVYKHCPSTCPPQTCESLDRAYICPIVKGKEPPCEPGCVCEDGFFKNKIGECISQANCLKCMGQNEYFSCDVECDNVCETLNEQSKDNCPIVNVMCNEKCYCEDGYARNKSNICIPIKDCPPSRCGPDERWEDNPCEVCEPLTCSEVGMEMDCPPAKDESCEDTPGCVCKNGLVRNDADECIPISECCK